MHKFALVFTIFSGSLPQKYHEKLEKFKSSFDAKQSNFAKQKAKLSQAYKDNSEDLIKLQEHVDTWAECLSDNFISIYLRVSGILVHLLHF